MARSKKSEVKRETSEEIDLLDEMHNTLVDLLEEKGIISRTRI